MNEISPVSRRLLIDCVEVVLRPIIQLALLCGLNCAEFTAIVRNLYVRIATERYGIRGRPTNISRVAALTGLSRREIRRIRSLPDTEPWSPDEAVNPLNTLIHYWRFDARYSYPDGTPRDLSIEGDGSFEELAKRYVSGIPAGALKREMLRQHVVLQDESGLLKLKKLYVFPSSLDSDFFRNWAFSLGALGGTLFHNAELHGETPTTEEIHREYGRFEQVAWSRRLSQDSIQAFQDWSRERGHQFVQEADNWIAKQEALEGSDPSISRHMSGIGVYFFVNEAGSSY